MFYSYTLARGSDEFLPRLLFTECLHWLNTGNMVLFIWLIIRLIQLVFSVETVFFSHKKSVNSVFQPAYNSSWTAPMIVLHVALFFSLNHISIACTCIYMVFQATAMTYRSTIWFSKLTCHSIKKRFLYVMTLLLCTLSRKNTILVLTYCQKGISLY
jgi:hypothetical protein